MDYLQLEFPIAVILVPTIGEAWSLISYHTFSYYIPPQIIKINDLAVFIGMKTAKLSHIVYSMAGYSINIAIPLQRKTIAHRNRKGIRLRLAWHIGHLIHLAQS